MKKIGLVGGTGPESTLMYYKELNSGIDLQTNGAHMPEIAIESVDFRKAGRIRFPSLLRFRSQSESQRTASPAPAYKQVHLQAAPSPKKKPHNARSRRLPVESHPYIK